MAVNHISKASFAAQATIADINNGHSLVFPEIDPIVKDILSRDLTIRKRIQVRPETHETFRWVEQTEIARNAKFSDPRNIAPEETNQPKRVEKLATLKTITSRIKYSFFESKLTQNGAFASILERDFTDAILDCLAVSNAAIYSGADKDYGAPSSNEYVGLFNVITNTETFNTTEPLYRQIKTAVARMTNKKFGEAKSLPTAIYMNPMTLDELEKEVDDKDNDFKFVDATFTPGVHVQGIRTVAGILPIIVDPEIPLVANKTDGTKFDHKILILNEDQIVRHAFTDGKTNYGDPVAFKLGLTESLVDDYVIFMADAVVCKYPNVAHCVATWTK